MLCWLVCIRYVNETRSTILSLVVVQGQMERSSSRHQEGGRGGPLTSSAVSDFSAAEHSGIGFLPTKHRRWCHVVSPVAERGLVLTCTRNAGRAGCTFVKCMHTKTALTSAAACHLGTIPLHAQNPPRFVECCGSAELVRTIAWIPFSSSRVCMPRREPTTIDLLCCG